jgi:hypothetical protein
MKHVKDGRLARSRMGREAQEEDKEEEYKSYLDSSINIR